VTKAIQLTIICGVLFIITPFHAFAQSVIFPTPSLPDIFASLKSTSDFISILLLSLSVFSLIISALVKLLSRFPLLFLTNKGDKWGFVFDSATKKKAAAAIVSLYKKQGNRLVLLKKIKTGRDGLFGFIANKGEYRIVATKYLFSFPSKYFKKSVESKPLNPYYGEEFVIVKDGDHPRFNIPIDPVFTPTAQAETKLYFYSRKLLPYLMTAGTIITLYNVYHTPTERRLILIGLYALVWFIIALGLYFTTQGIRVISAESGLPIVNAIVEFTNPELGKKHTYLTNDIGRTNPAVPAGEYEIKVHRPNYNSKKIKTLYRPKTPFEVIVFKI